MKPNPGYVVILAAFLALNGCVETAVVKRQPRESVRFASANGAQIFYEAYIAKNYTRPMSERGYISISVAAQLPYRHNEYATDDVYFNAAVAAADVNHDGVISDDEARLYALSLRPMKKGLVAVAK